MACPKQDGTGDQGQKTPTSEKHLGEIVVVREALATFCSRVKTAGDMVVSSWFLFLRNRNTEKT